jgi:hypothetical protein
MNPTRQSLLNPRRLLLTGVAACLTFVGLAVTPALAQDVSYKFDSQTNFSTYKTYRWEKHPNSIDLDAATLKQLGTAFDAELVKKGLTRTDASTADIVIVYQVAIKVDQEITSFQSGWSPGPAYSVSWSTNGGPGSTTSFSSNIIPVGSIDLDMFDAARKQLIWRGVITKSLEAGASPEKQKKNIAAAAAKLLKNYPPKKK